MTRGASDRRGQAFGLSLRADFPLPTALPPGKLAAPALRIRCSGPAREPGSSVVWRTHVDGTNVVVRRCPSGALHVRFGRDATFRIDPAAGTVHCSPRRGADQLRWQRFLLDTVLWAASLVHGRVALHAAAVADADGAVAIAAGTGGGKTSLALALLRRGRALVADDVLVVSAAPAMILGHPSPPVLNVDATQLGPVDPAPVRVVGRFGGEAWVEAQDFVPAPVPMRAVVVVSREDRAVPAATTLEGPRAFRTLESHSVSLPGLPRLHAQTRFEVLTEVASRVPVVQVRVPRTLSPDAVADLIEETLSSESRREGAAIPALKAIRA